MKNLSIPKTITNKRTWTKLYIPVTWTPFLPISQKQYLWHPTHSSWSCLILTWDQVSHFKVTVFSGQQVSNRCSTGVRQVFNSLTGVQQVFVPSPYTCSVLRSWCWTLAVYCHDFDFVNRHKISVSKLDVVEYECPHIVTESVGVKMTLYHRNKKMRLRL